MAILVDQDKKPVNWFGIIISILIVVFLGATIYYVFFVNPPLIEKVILPPTLEKTRKFKTASIDVQSVVSDSVFRSLNQHINAPTIGTLGRVNPFAPF